MEVDGLLTVGGTVPLDDPKTLKHVRVYNWLKGLIVRGRFKQGEKLPTETEIAEMFSVNRMTVRQAMDMLVQEKYITRVRGKGTFLAERSEKVTYLLDNIISFETIAKDFNLRSSYKVIHKEIGSLSAEIANDLMVTPTSKVINIIRLVYGNDIPYFIERSFFPYPEFEFIMDMDFNQPKIYSLVQEKTGAISLNRSVQVLSSSLLEDDEKVLLDYPSEIPVPCIRQKNIIYDVNSVPVLVFYATFPGDKFQFKVHSKDFMTYSF